MIPNNPGLYHTKCPKCGGIRVTSISGKGTYIQCPYCGKRFAALRCKVNE